MKAVIRPAARDDILRQFRYYLVDKDAPEIAARFFDAVEESVQKLLANPYIGSPKLLSNPVLAGLRSWPVERANDFRIYYLLQGETVRVVRVLHGKRNVVELLEQEAHAPLD